MKKSFKKKKENIIKVIYKLLSSFNDIFSIKLNRMYITHKIRNQPERKKTSQRISKILHRNKLSNFQSDLHLEN